MITFGVLSEHIVVFPVSRGECRIEEVQHLLCNECQALAGDNTGKAKVRLVEPSMDLPVTAVNLEHIANLSYQVV